MNTTFTKTNLLNVHFDTEHTNLNASIEYKEKFELLQKEFLASFPAEQQLIAMSFCDRFCDLHNAQLNSLFQDYLQYVCFLVDSLDLPGSEGAFTAGSQDSCMSVFIDGSTR
jgi:hypothetical protein